jgi:hypothetical protein
MHYYYFSCILTMYFYTINSCTYVRNWTYFRAFLGWIIETGNLASAGSVCRLIHDPGFHDVGRRAHDGAHQTEKTMRLEFCGQFFKRIFAPTEKFAPWQCWVSAQFKSTHWPQTLINPTITSYNASVVKIYSASNSIAHFDKKIYLM